MSDIDNSVSPVEPTDEDLKWLKEVEEAENANPT